MSKAVYLIAGAVLGIILLAVFSFQADNFVRALGTTVFPNNVEVDGDLNVLGLIYGTFVGDINGNVNLSGYVKDAVYNSGFPLTDANVPDTITATNYVRNTVFNGFYPVADVNLSALTWSKLQSYPAGCGAGQAVQVIDDTLTCIAVGGGGGGSGTTYTSGTPATIQVNNDLNTISINFDGNFNSRASNLFPVADANISSAATWNAKASLANINSAIAAQIPLGDGNAPTYVRNDVFNAGFPLADGNAPTYARSAVFNAAFPLVDANVPDTITAINYVRNSIFNAFYPVADANISSAATWNAKASLANINSAIAGAFPVADVNISSAATWNAKASLANINSAIAGVFPIADSNLSLSYVKSTIFNAFYPVADANISSAATWNAKASLANINSAIAGAFPVADGNLASSFVKSAVFNGFYPVADGNISSAGTWNAKASLANINSAIAVQIPLGDGNAPTYVRNAIFNAAFPIVDANVPDTITLSNLTQVTTRSYLDLSNLPFIPSTLSFDANYNFRLSNSVPWADANVADDVTAINYVRSAIFNAMLPLADVNIVSASVWNAKPTVGVWNGAWPVADANISSAATWNAKASLANINSAIAGAFPVADSNLSSSFVKSVVFNGFYPVADGNISSAATWNAKASLANVNSAIAGAFPVADANISSATAWNAKASLANVNTAIAGVFPVADVNISSATAWNAKASLANVNTAVAGAFPVADANVADDITAINYTRSAIFNAVFPLADANISSAATWNAKASLANINSIVGAAFPVADSNLVTSYVKSVVFNGFYPITDANISSAGTWNAKASLANINTAIAGAFPVADINLSSSFVKSSIFNAFYPVADANISSAAIWNAKPTGGVWNASWPVNDGNVLNKIGGFGTTNYIPKFSDANTLANSVIYQTADGNMGIGTTAPKNKLNVIGDINVTGNIRDSNSLIVISSTGTHRSWIDDNGSCARITSGTTVVYIGC